MVTTPTVVAMADIPIRIAHARRKRSSMMARIIPLYLAVVPDLPDAYEMPTGLITDRRNRHYKNWKDDRGVGFIKTDEDRILFLHISHFVEDEPHPGKRRASRCRSSRLVRRG
jgi:hypothetical protein